MNENIADKSRSLQAAIGLALLGLAALAPGAARAGPPFFTDDPEPVEYKHGEFYIATQLAKTSGG